MYSVYYNYIWMNLLADCLQHCKNVHYTNSVHCTLYTAQYTLYTYVSHEYMYACV